MSKTASWTKRTKAIVAASTALVILTAAGLTIGLTSAPQAAAGTSSAPGVAPDSSKKFTPLTPDQVAALPAATYDAVVPGLVAFTTADTTAMTTSYIVTTDTPLYNDARTKAVARLLATDFLEAPTVVVPVGKSGKWTLVMTPARVELPSKNGGTAPAQSAGWIRTDALSRPTSTPDRIVVSVTAGTLTILDKAGKATVYEAGVGTSKAPSPTGVTGYLQQRYVDPSQGTGDTAIQLTSLHSAAADEPYSGSDGGLIGIHFNKKNSGQVSHGCIRIAAAAVAAVNMLPLGTPITITD